MKKIQVFHNTRCSKSCTALNFLKEHEIENQEIEVILYLQDQISKETAEKIVHSLDGDISELIRTADAKKLGIEVPKPITKEWVVENILKEPRIMQRPIIIKNGKAIIARSPEKLNELI